MNSDWNDLLRDYFKVDLDTEEIARWYAEVDKELHTSPTELECAIRFAATHKEHNRFDGKPSLKDLLIWVKWYRKTRRQERDGTLPASTKDGFISMLKSRILNAQSHMDRWNILCDPQIYCGAPRTTTHEECQALENFCIEKYKDWRRPTVDELIEEYARTHPVTKQDAVDDVPF